MQYVRSTIGSVSKTWNSINPATLSGAIDVIVVEHEDGSLACSPFHVRFGKFSLLRPSEKKVEFSVNGRRQDYAMKLGEGGEAFFIFETVGQVPEGLQTSPLVSPVSSPTQLPISPSSDPSTRDPEPLDLDAGFPKLPPLSRPAVNPLAMPERRAQSHDGLAMHAPHESQLSQSFPEDLSLAQRSESWSTSPALKSKPSPVGSGNGSYGTTQMTRKDDLIRPTSPPALPKAQALTRAMTLSEKLKSSNIASQVTDEGDLMLDVTGYKTTEEQSLRAELIARQILSEEMEGDYDIGSLIGVDEKGTLWIYSSEESKEAAARKAAGFNSVLPPAMISSDAISDPGYQSDDTQSQKSIDHVTRHDRRNSDSGLGLLTPPVSPAGHGTESSRNYAKTLRLTSDQLKSLDLKPGANPVSYSVNRAMCQAFMYLWKWDAPIVISDIDGTITKSDALGHVLNMLGRDWTHLGVAKLYSDIVANGYNILYLTSRSVGQADTTRTYINGIVQEGYKLPKGPVIMSPDRTIAALRREIYLRKPEVFKMSCLRDIMTLFGTRSTPFYAGFGNRLTDALSYRSVNIPSTRIFTINSNAEVSLDLLSLNTYKTGYTSMRETVDHVFPPVAMLVHDGGEEFTDFNYWRERPNDIDDMSMSDSDADLRRQHSRRSLQSFRNEDDGSEGDDEEDDNVDEDDDDYDDEILGDDMRDSHISRATLDETLNADLRSRADIETNQDFEAKRNDKRNAAAGIDEETLDALDLVTHAPAASGSKDDRTRIRDVVQAFDKNRALDLQDIL